MGNYRNLSEYGDMELRNTLGVLGDMTRCNSRDNTIEKIKAILAERETKTGVFIKTVCGEEHHVKPTQTVSEIYIDGNQVYPTPPKAIFNEPKCREDVKKMVEFLHGGKWRFSTNTADTTYEQLKNWVNTTPENVVIVPWAFYGSYRNDRGCFGSRTGPYKNDMKLESSNAVWVRC